MASGSLSSSEPIEPTRVWTAEEWDTWNTEVNDGSYSRRFRKYDTFRRMYTPGEQVNVQA